MAHPNRPLSPHLQVYRPQMTSTMSILHRITGVSLAVGGISLVWWLMSIAAGGEAYEFASRQWASPMGLIFLFGFTLALIYHLLNGIRHLLWDAGWGFEIPKAYASGYAVFVVGFLITGIIWFFGLRGAA
ncbi:MULTISPECIES: succinate dehydrogenase, cytochrome b556 subunit [unclassified Luteimonas]|jgi:succinate dehydrogenase / fumarate reductase, cytochrome b subunit|uniref:succinate dehydrogenase, cytochrome b556 subunit n=1 Tax=unclassified Luteimonas TaxID=2629088 RepID=UPI000B8D4092|nr:succinate dehydrogenase, cytochrome b556 subunit [Luteimonas sp. RC10]ASR44569.1 succinate dehydrogenase, cytochrome b556 subunit [Xanthomonas citri pv. mangiferaeindicae]